MSNVIEFPYGRIRNPLVDPGPVITTLDRTEEVIKVVITKLIELDYDPTQKQLAQDLGMIMNLLYAVLTRAEGGEHFLAEAVDELFNELMKIKRELENDNP